MAAPAQNDKDKELYAGECQAIANSDNLSDIERKIANYLQGMWYASN
ncbi:hypothetical protein ACF3DV_26730 [Chlorogloeopsis fritschii PCC 9212]|uniref:Uncharacterized protein n=1 Tax=Chlorogloeopsis fritschii PCC 6912 TaxID=211165 RepID=A0A433N3V0_CHLFR|nr:hypothetical protein [Chlorogloeopsis fritschii]RUR75931.1 hypothetical protein PCC6912_45030 [Chlorogloeopsis fritschii PCC 6912]